VGEEEEKEERVSLPRPPRARGQREALAHFQAKRTGGGGGGGGGKKLKSRCIGDLEEAGGRGKREDHLAGLLFSLNRGEYGKKEIQVALKMSANYRRLRTRKKPGWATPSHSKRIEGGGGKKEQEGSATNLCRKKKEEEMQI